MLKIKFLNSFKKDYKRIVKRGYDIALLENVIRMLADGETLPAKYRDHTLTGNYSSYRECHIAPDWLLIYEVRESELIFVGHNIIPFSRRVLNA